ncbi:hypothetical protein [Haloarcula salinisoli]|uniref:Uncharacterized protein n=1 Tax=Haloarcula salinisoli TaxID=2487746 RepID=A0A8J8C7E7_9EURY|nr:hypothetical protein [Halomicroarcula salinisoli]MBX0285256.1 hypothetical protein [Halomicroarcula salinisoli]MBX0303266.1 hypothetical protein [Halomicroarcula salinisoli]
MTEQMKDVDHTHPHTDSAFGSAFTRGSAVAADGGEPSDGRRASSEPRSDGGKEADETTQTMADVDHESAADGVDRAYERGTEGRDETV